MSADAGLVYDVGLHRGEDTEFYLKKGYRIIAFEANPELVRFCRERFSQQLLNGRLRIVEGAIAPRSAPETVTFFVNEVLSVWGTADPSMARRNAVLGAENHAISVPRVDFGDALAAYGMPFYLKIDIEGADRIVLEALRDAPERPPYISTEAPAGAVDLTRVFDDLRLLHELGYTKFQVVQQARIPRTKIRTQSLDGAEFEHIFGEHASGPFGPDLGSDWLGYRQVVARYRWINARERLLGAASPIERHKLLARALRKLARTCGVPITGWHDTHAAL